MKAGRLCAGEQFQPSLQRGHCLVCCLQVAEEANPAKTRRPRRAQVEIFEAEFRAYDEVKQAFTKAAAADESWSDVQEAAYAVSSDENASRRKIDAACDRLRS